MGIPNSLGNFAWGSKFPVCWGIPKTLKGFQNPCRGFDSGVPNSRGCRIPYDTGLAFSDLSVALR